MFIAKNTSVWSEEDIWEEGCQPNSQNKSNELGYEMKADSLPLLIEKLMNATGAYDKEDVLLDSCDEKGRIDIQVLKTFDDNSPSIRQIANWKEGTQRLWLVTYIFRIEETTPADFTNLKGYSRS